MQITKLGGLGALTTGNGIEVVSALNGATTTAQTTKDAFALGGGHVDAGAFEYRLYAADATGPARTGTCARPPRRRHRRRTTSTTGGSGTGAMQVPAYRAEVPLFAALPRQLRQTDLAMIGNLHQRIGDDDVKGSGPAAGDTERRAWGRVIATTSTSASKAPSRRTATATPGASRPAPTCWPHRTGAPASTSASSTAASRSAGSPAASPTWASVPTTCGATTWAPTAPGPPTRASMPTPCCRPGGTATPPQPLFAQRSAGKGDSLMASIEVGQAFAMGESGWKIEPQLQLIHQHMGLDDIAISGARVRQDSDDGWIARIGVRLKGEIATSLGTLQPYGRFNLYQASGGADVARFIGPGALRHRERHGLDLGRGGRRLHAAAHEPTPQLYGAGRQAVRGWAAPAQQQSSALRGSLGMRVRW